jgi:cholesterol oxidase
LIIGSGYGSAVTALRLTEAGFDVTMLEAGRLWMPGEDGTTFCKPFAPDGRAMWFADRTETQLKTFYGQSVEMDVPYEAGVLEARGPAEMRVFQGKGVGGGSLVNMAVYLPPDPEMLAKALPVVEPDEFYDTYLPRAFSVLGPGSASQRLIDADCYQYSRVGIALANAIGQSCQQLQSGYDMSYMEMELDDQVPRSALGGEAGFGNNHGKKSLDKTYLADALGTGRLTIHALHVVKRIKLDPSGGYVVEVDNIDVSGNIVKRKEFTCTHLFIGAGSMATSELMVRARERGDLPKLNDSVGTEWGPNGDLFVALDTPSTHQTGALQSTIPSHYFTMRDAQGRRVLSQFAPLPIGIPNAPSFVIAIVDNREAGHFTYDSGADAVDLRWTRSQNEPSLSAARFVYDQVNAKFGSRYSEVITFADDSQFGDQVTYHPVGGMPLGAATDEYGRIREYPGLYVMDGSLISIGLGANPSATITALAERNIERILATDLKG